MPNLFWDSFKCYDTADKQHANTNGDDRKYNQNEPHEEP